MFFYDFFAIEKPSPVPQTKFFVVKNGLKIMDRVAPSMLWPLSMTSILAN